MIFLLPDRQTIVVVTITFEATGSTGINLYSFYIVICTQAGRYVVARLRDKLFVVHRFKGDFKIQFFVVCSL